MATKTHTPTMPLTRLGRRTSLALLALFILALPWPTPTVGAQAGGGGSIDEADGTGDVRLKEPTLGPAAPRSEGLDITRARLFGESGVSIVLIVSLQNLAIENDNTDAVNNGIIISSCFTWQDTLYAASIRYRLGIGARLTMAYLGTVQGQCTPGQAVVFSETVTIISDVFVDLVNSQMTVILQRTKLLELTGRAPAAGDTMGALHVLVSDGAMNRFDQAPDDGPSAQSFTLRFDTANLGTLSAAPVSNVQDSSCDGRIDFPPYGMEAKGTQGIPIEFRNSGSEPLVVNFEVSTIGGQDWDPTIVPSLVVPPSALEGNTTLTAIVTLPEDAQHKACTILSVRGETTDGQIGETGVIVVAVQTPSPEHNTLWLHTNSHAAAGADCASQNSWLNVVEDEGSPDVDIRMKACRDPPLFTNAPVAVSAFLDVPPNYDLILNTSAPGVGAFATGLVRMRSDFGDTRARMTSVLATLKGEVVAISDEQEVTFGAAGKDIEIRMNVPFIRDVRPEGDPSRVVRGADGLVWTISHRPVTTGTAPSVAWLVSSGTHVELPIWGTIKRNANNPGELGNLLSLRPNAALPEFAAPGAPRVVNFTVLNEGAATDRVAVEVAVERVTNWTSLVVPNPPFELAAGERRSFTVVITPRADAVESEEALVDVVVYSELDPTARNSIAFSLKATRSGGVEGDIVPTLGGESVKKGLPGPGALALLVALGVAMAVAGAVRRRGE